MGKIGEQKTGPVISLGLNGPNKDLFLIRLISLSVIKNLLIMFVGGFLDVVNKSGVALILIPVSAPLRILLII